jgi:ABC-2 type transport system ATP-binding protein
MQQICKIYHGASVYTCLSYSYFYTVDQSLQFQGVSKRFGELQALQDVCFSIPQGAMFGLLGPNGAGKTTLIRIITNIIGADSGTIQYNGKPLESYGFGFIGYMPEEKGMYKKMKVGELLLYLARLKGLSKAAAKERIAYWFGRLGMEDWWSKKIQELSKGMQQKVQFIATVIHEPSLLILDEPFSGLDPVNAEVLKNEIFHLHDKGTTIVFSTHRMEQVEEICQEIVLINKGSVLLNGAVADIKNTYKKNIYYLKTDSVSALPPSELYSIVHAHDNQHRLLLEANTTVNTLLQSLLDNQVQVREFSEVLPSLNEIFIQLVKGASHE